MFPGTDIGKDRCVETFDGSSHYEVSDHFYTTSAAEIGTVVYGATGAHGYKCEGITGYVATAPGPGLHPIYRYWHAGGFLKTSKAELIV